MPHWIGRVAAVAIASWVVALTPSSAQALGLTPPGTDCAAQPMSQPFAAWGDDAEYTPVPDGGFEAGAAGWRLAGAAVVDRDGEESAAGNRHALALPDGARATSPPICIGLGHPTVRLLARNVGSPLGLLTVEVLARTSLGLTLPVPIGIVMRGNSAWAPTPRLLTLVNLLMIVPPGTTDVAFRFRSIGIRASWMIDDVYVDPYAKR